MTYLGIAALVLMAGLVTTILVTRSVSVHSGETARPVRTSGFRFFLTWFFFGGLAALVTCAMFLLAGIGGVATPPDIWLIFYSLGIVVLPILLTLGGVPAAIQIAHGEAWKRTAFISLAVCITSWVVVAGVVFLGPSIFGWSW